MGVVVQRFQKDDFPEVLKIYEEGINTGIGTFETLLPHWDIWDKKYVKQPRLVAKLEDLLVGFAVVSKASNRKVYCGVAEVSVYVAENNRGLGIGKRLLEQLILDSESHGIWTLQASIFPQNSASIKLHASCGFRMVEKREKIGELHGIWHDNVLLERRSKKI